jgi:F0F1-type ATP synthase assembly protein I
LSWFKLDREYIDRIARAASIGLAMVFALAIACLLGWWVDKTWPGVAPWGKVMGLIVGIASAYRNLFIMYRRLAQDQDKDKGGS